MKIFGSSTSKTTKNKNGENVPCHKVILVHCNIANNNYEQKSKVSYTFVPNKPFGQLLDILPKNLISFKNV